MSKLFEESHIGKIFLKNRFVRAATWEGLATHEGAVTPRLKEMMLSLTRGGVGMIITSHAYVSPEGQGTPWQLGVYKDEFITGLRDMTSAVHENGGRIILQLAHAGQYADEKLTRMAALAVSPSAAFSGRNVKIITDADIRSIVECYARAAKRALLSGFDGIEIHAAHGYFLSQFLSPAYNKRSDEYGGTLENRIRIHTKIFRAIRESVGRDFPVLIKMNCADFIEDGLTSTDSLQAAKHFAAAGFDAIELSGGIIRTGKLSPSRPEITTVEREAYFKEYAGILKKQITIPLILVGGLRSFEVAEEMVISGTADYISMSRPLIREPGLINRWRDGDLRKAECKSCNLCFNPGFEGKGIYCVAKENKKSGNKIASHFS